MQPILLIPLLGSVLSDGPWLGIFFVGVWALDPRAWMHRPELFLAVLLGVLGLEGMLAIFRRRLPNPGPYLLGEGASLLVATVFFGTIGGFLIWQRALGGSQVAKKLHAWAGSWVLQMGLRMVRVGASIAVLWVAANAGVT